MRMEQSKIFDIMIAQQNEIDAMKCALNRQCEIIKMLELLLMQYMTAAEIEAVKGGRNNDS